MIKIFRSTRKLLLMETGKTAKYLKYAIGEIVLVVIGILIALQINNWNEHRKLKLLEKTVIESLTEDLQIDYIHFENNKIFLENQLKLVDELIIDPANSKLAKKDPSYLRYNVELYPISFEDNIPKDISNKTIIEAVKTYYRDQQQIMEAQKIYSKVIFDMVRPFLRTYGIHNPKAALNPDLSEAGNSNFLVEEKLAKHYGSDEFGQILFEQRVKTAEFIKYLDELTQSNRALIPVLKAYTND